MSTTNPLTQHPSVGTIRAGGTTNQWKKQIWLASKRQPTNSNAALAPFTRQSNTRTCRTSVSAAITLSEWLTPKHGLINLKTQKAAPGKLILDKIHEVSYSNLYQLKTYPAKCHLPGRGNEKEVSMHAKAYLISKAPATVNARAVSLFDHLTPENQAKLQSLLAPPAPAAPLLLTAGYPIALLPARCLSSAYSGHLRPQEYSAFKAASAAIGIVNPAGNFYRDTMRAAAAKMRGVA